MTITVGPSVWFIDNTAPAGGNGTQASPFNSIAAFNAANNGAAGNPGAGDVIYLRFGTGTYAEADGINLLDGQRLVGQGENLVVTPTGGGPAITVETGSALQTPTIVVTGAGNQGIQLAQNNTVSGLDVGMNNATAVGIADGGGTVGTLTISNVGVGIGQSLGSAVDIDQGGTLNVQLDSVTSSGAARGIDLGSIAGLAGTGNNFTVLGLTTISDATGDGIAIANSSLSATFTGDVTVVNDVGAGTVADGIELGTGAGGANTGTYSFNGGVNITVNGTGAFGFRAQSSGTVNILNPDGDNQITSENGTAFLVNPTTVNATLSSLTSGGGSEGISLNGMSGSLTIGTVAINGQTGDGIDVTNSAGSLTINGGTIGNTNDPTGIGVDVNGGAGNVTIAASVAKTSTNDAVEVTGRSGGTVTFSGALTSSNAGLNSGGIDVNGNSGGATVTFTGPITLSTGGVTAVDLQNNTGATINFNAGGTGLDITTNSATGFNSVTGGTVTVTGTGNSITTSGNGTALTMGGVTVGVGGVRFENVTVSGSPSGVSNGMTFLPNLVQAVGSSGIDIIDGSIQNALSRGVDIDGTNADISIGADITTTTLAGARSVEVTSTTGNRTIEFTGAITDSSLGINLASNNGSNINFTGQTTISTGANTGVTVFNNTNTNVTFNAGGNGLDITTTSGIGFNANNNTGSSTVTVLDADGAGAQGNSINSGNGTALNVVSTTIGASGLTFQSISSGNNNAGADPASGIILNTTGSAGGLTVTGTGTTAGSGGTIQNTTGHGISLTSTSNVNLSNMIVQGSGQGVGDGDGIHGVGVNNFTLDGSSIINNGNSTTEDGIQFGESSGSFVGVTGNVTITDSNISGNAHNNVHIRNTSGNIGTLTVSNSSFSNLNDTFGANAFLFEASGTSTVTEAFLTGNTFANNSPQRALEVQAHDTATISDFVGQRERLHRQRNPRELHPGHRE